MAQTGFANALRDREEISITVTGRRSGREVRLPVWFVLAGTALWLLPLHGAHTQWYRNVLAEPAITLRAGRQVLTARGRPRRARRTVQWTVEQFRRKYGAALVARYFDRPDVAVEVPIQARGGRTDRRKQPDDRTGTVSGGRQTFGSVRQGTRTPRRHMGQAKRTRGGSRADRGRNR